MLHGEYELKTEAGWWRKNVVRPKKREDDIPTRSDIRFHTKPEIAIRAAMAEVEGYGASPALTEAVNLLVKAKDLVADHVEDPEIAKQYR